MIKLVKVCLLNLMFLAVALSQASAGTVTANSCTSSDVASAIANASNGDTVVVPAGTCTWSGVTVNKTLTIQGAGIDKTVIRQGGFVLGSGVNNVRITGFTFDGNFQNGQFFSGGWGTAGNKDFRLDHNKFMNRPYSTNNSITTYGYSYGVIDHNQFLNTCDETMSFGSDGSTSYTRSGVGGYTNGTVFIEDNTFTLTNAGISGCGADSAENVFDSNSGPRITFRHNTVTNASGLRWQKALEAHGFESEFAPPAGDARGVYSVEVYENTFITNWPGSGIIGIKMRGGKGVIYNNVFMQGTSCSGTCSWGSPVFVSNYRSDSANSSSVVKTAMNRAGYTQWCHTRQSDEGGLTCEGCGGVYGVCRDQISNLYVWGNTDNTVAVDGGGYIQSDIVAGKNYFNTAMPGYTPYRYPHPLTVSGETPSPPEKLTVN